MAAMKGLNTYQGQSPFPAWLLGIARNKAADLFRRQHPDIELDKAEEISDSGEGLDEVVDRQMAVEQVARKLQTISPDRAEALSLRLFAGLEVPEIAQMMNKNEAAVRMLVFRGLRDLQAQLNVTEETEK
jgi:RNA polymerase sigma-70 factor (ECF subfamily)